MTLSFVKEQTLREDVCLLSIISRKKNMHKYILQLNVDKKNK